MLYCKTERLQIEREQAEVLYCEPEGTSSRATQERTKEEGGGVMYCKEELKLVLLQRENEMLLCKTQPVAP